MTSLALFGGGASAGSANIQTVADSDTASAKTIVAVFSVVFATKGVPAVNHGGVTSGTVIALTKATVSAPGDATPFPGDPNGSPVCVAKNTS